MRSMLLFISLGFSSTVFCQSYKLYGKVVNGKQDPLPFASVQVKEFKSGVVTKEDGSFSIELDEGKYDLVITLVGYKPQVITVIMRKANQQQDIIMEAADAGNLSEVVVKAKSRDRAEEYIRNIIRNKETIEKAAGDYSCKVYIKALQEDSMPAKKSKKTVSDSLLKIKQAKTMYNGMAMAEIVLQLDKGSGKKIKEERTGISRKGNAENLFFLSVTEGDFSIYNNLITIPSISQTTFVSPLSYSGLLAYRYKIIKTAIINGKKIFTISVKPRSLSNATVEGEITIADSIWVVLHTTWHLPKYHLPEYDFFEVDQQYSLINDSAWMITRQQFTYNAASGKRKSSGRTVVTYNNFELHKQFDKKHFGVEVSASTTEAYKRDSSFWQVNRTEPLTEKEVRFIHYKDSVYSATHTKAYLDSIDKKINKITLLNILYKGQNFNNHEKRRNWYIPALPAFYQPLQFGGARIQPNFAYFKTWQSRKNISIFFDASYGFRNKDINGSIQVNRMYNPFNRGFYNIRIKKDFEYIFSGDAWTRQLSRNNMYLNKAIGFGHGLEIANGLFFFSDVDMAYRRSLSDYKTNDWIDSTDFGIHYLPDNNAKAFAPHNAFYGSLRLEYTPRQRYIREPKEKVILGSSWPTFYASWKKGIPGIFNSDVNFDYLEFGMKQSLKLGTFGTSAYTFKTGSFLNTRDLRIIDYKYQRQGDTLFFSNPNEAFQSLDSTFPVFKRFYEGHWVHEFNGAFLNKIPLFKKIGLREVAGIGLLYVPERNHLRYGEIFVGAEKVFKYPFNQLGKFKLGVYIVASAANQFRNGFQFKIGVTSWDKKKGKWQ